MKQVSFLGAVLTLFSLEHFLDEGLSEDVVLDLKATWEHHLEHSKVTYNYPPPRPKPAINRPSLHGGSGDLAEVDLIGSAEHVVAAPSQEEAEKGDEDITSEDDEPNTLDPEALFDTENILVCQYEKIVKAKNKWKLLLKSGIMTVNEKDYVFQKCGGDANW